MMRLRCLLTLVAGLAACTTGAARAGSFTFTTIASSSESFDTFSGGASINNAGTVAFHATLDGGGGGIFTGNGGTTTTIADGASFRPNDFGQFPAINNAGAVAFEAIPYTGGVGVYLSSGGTTTTMAFTDGPLLLVGSPALNNSNEVAFRGHLDAQPTAPLVFRTDGVTLTTIADTAGAFSSFGYFTVMNDAGTVAFYASLDGGGSGIFTGTGGATTPIATTAGEFASFTEGGLAINNAGLVTFLATLDSGVSGLFSSSGGTIATLVDTSGPFSFIGAPMLNQSGQIAFGALLDAGGMGIFTGTDPIADRVIGTGDALDGSTVTNLNYFRGLNDSGQIAFFAELEDGRSGIYVATRNNLVPEPSSLALAGCGALLGLLQLARRHRKRAA